MANLPLSGLTIQSPSDITTLRLAGIDLTKPQGSRNRTISASAMLAAYIAANTQSSNGTGGLHVNSQLNISIPLGSSADCILYTPLVQTNDVAMVTLQFGQNSIIPQPFTFRIYAGVPSGTGKVIYDSSLATGSTIKTAQAFCQSTVYVPASAGSNVLYVRIINAGTSQLLISFEGVFLEFPGSGIVLPTFVPPPPYLGALMSTVHVGPNEQFTQPVFGLAALADGGTMILDDDHYYLPIGILNINDQNITGRGRTYAGNDYNVYGGTSANPSNRFTGGVTIKSASGNPYSCVWDGLGGIGAGFDLALGKGIILSHIPITIQGISFINGGGADLAGDGECGIYAESYLQPGIVLIQNCGFDNCENGVLVPDLDSNINSPQATQNTGPGVNVTAHLLNCDFGFNAGNGITSDGLSHNFYYEGPLITVEGCNMYSAAVGNSQKCRGPQYVGLNCYIESGAGRALDLPEGGTATFTGCTLATTPNANASFLDYNSEDTVRPWRKSSFTNPIVNGGTIICTRNPEAQIWVNAPSNIAYEFRNVAQQWFSYYGRTPGFIPERIQSGFQSDFSAAVGLFLNPSQGGTILSSPPVRPGSIAQPGAVSTPITAWNGTVSANY